ncbi:MAG TPA: hypothetical protein VNZ64_23975 [Candidatus Acidoferrum sp.]|jgi:hypothetical protein|nr:hypothetical protein [Candidatus Acidoferrum sp.]
MRKSSSTTVLLGLLVISALLSIGFFLGSVYEERELRSLQPSAAMVNNKRAFVGALAAEAAEYSKKNPTIDPILEAVGVKPGKGNPTPAAKTATK